MSAPTRLSRRRFLTATGCAVASVAAGAEAAPEAIIDIHQHTTDSGRTNPQLIAHQQAMGVTTTVLLPAGRLYGLDAKCGRNDTVLALAKERPGEYVFFANEITDIPEAREEIENYLKL